MKPLTSLADFHFRVKDDPRYKLLAIEAYKSSSYCPRSYNGTYEIAINWIEEWTEARISRQVAPLNTCEEMINYLNRTMQKMDIFKNSLISPHTINTFTQEKVEDR